MKKETKRIDLLQNMEFDKLEEFYKEQLEISNEYLYKYIIFLSETGRILDGAKLIDGYKVKELIEKGDMKKYETYDAGDEKYMQYLLLRFNFDKNFNQFRYYYLDEKDEELLNIIENHTESLYEYFKLNKQKYFGINKVFGNVFSIIHAYKILIDRKELDEELAIDLLRQLRLMGYTPLVRKYMVKKIIEYMEVHNPDFFLYQEGYNHMPMFHYVLSNCDMKEFYPGAKKYTALLNKYSKITEPDMDNPLEVKIPGSKKKNTKPRIAVCFSGATRFNIKKQLQEYKDKMISNLEEEADVDIYVHTWNTHQTFAGLGSRKLPGAIWYERHFPEVAKSIPKDIIYTENFEDLLPNTFRIFTTPVDIKNKKKNFTDIFQNAIVEMEDPSDFEEKYDSDNFIRNGLLNQAKMFYGMDKVHQMALDSGKNYDYVIRARADFVPATEINFDVLRNLKDDELVIPRQAVVGATDVLMLGKTLPMTKIINIWKLALKYNDLSPLLHNGKKYLHDSHRLLDSTLAYYNITSNMVNHIYIDLHFASNDMEIPNFTQALKDDLEFVAGDTSVYSDFFHENFNKFVKK